MFCIFEVSSLHFRVTRLKAVGAPFGIDFAHKAPVTPNTLKAHALLDYAKKQGDGSKQDLVSEKLFKVDVWLQV